MHFAYILGICIIFFVANINGDACDFTNIAQELPDNEGYRWVTSPSAIQSCFQIVPFDSSQNFQTLAALVNLTNVYAFTDFAVNSGPPYNIQVDLQSELASITAKVQGAQYTNNFDFHMDLVNLFRRLKDAHTQYVAPAGFGCFVVRPFDFQSQQTIPFLGAQQLSFTDSDFTGYFNQSYSSYDGKLILSINNMNALDYLTSYAETEIGLYKYYTVAVNQVLQRAGIWTAAGIFADNFPGSTLNEPLDSFAVTFNDSSQTFPKQAVCIMPTPWASVNDVVALNNAPQYVHNIKNPKSKYNDFNPLKERRKHIEKLLPRGRLNEPKPFVPLKGTQREKTQHDVHFITKSASKMQDTTFITPPPSPVITTTLTSIMNNTNAATGYAGDIFYYTFGDITVLKITDFEPTNYPADYITFLNIVATAVSDAKTKNIQKLVVDVSSNGGGDICLGIYFMTLLVQDWTGGNFNHSTVAYSHYDFRESSYTDSLNANTDFLSQVVQDLNSDGSPVTDTNSVYTQSTQYTRGGRTSSYARKDYFPNCAQYFTDLNINVDYYFPKIIFTSDGECGSTCNSVICHLKDMNRIQTLTYGGLLGQDLDIASFAGGNVVAWSDFVTGINNNQYAAALPCSATVRFAQHEVYAEGSNTPREFIRQYSDYHAYMWQPVYDSAANLGNTVYAAQLIFNSDATSILVNLYLLLAALCLLLL